MTCFYDGLNFGKPSGYDEIQAALRELIEERLREVLGDLTPQRGKSKALLSDSRQITDYGKVLLHTPARRVLRDYQDLNAAVQLVRVEDLPARLEHVAGTLNAMADEVDDAPRSDELEEALDSIRRAFRKLKGLMALKESDEE